MRLYPLQFVLQFPERLAVDERNTGELLHHLAHGRLGDGADVSHSVSDDSRLRTAADAICRISAVVQSYRGDSIA